MSGSQPYATLGGLRVVSGSVSMPYYGAWVADVVLALSDVVPTTGPLVIGNLSLVGTVYRVASFSGARSARVVGGYAGWRNTLPSKPYQSPNGIPLAMVLGDAATEVGEKINVVSPATIGTAYVRESGPAERLLRQLAGPLWYIDPAGVTQVASARPSAVITSEFQVTAWSGGKGRFSIATEDIASWVPGNTFSSPTVTTPQTLSFVRYGIEDDGTLRVEALS